MTRVKVYRNSKDTHGSIVTLQAVRERILDGKRGLDEKTRYCNATATTDPQAYKLYKEKQLPAVTFSGTFPKGRRKAQYLVDHSSLITIDIDGLPPEQIPDLLAELAQMPHVVLAFISPSGLGIKVIVRVDPIPTNDLEHKGAYQACLDFFENLTLEYGFEIDTTGKDCSRLCYLAHDPLAIFHENAPAIDWDKDAWIAEQTEKQERFEADAKKAYTGEADVKALDFIDPNDLDYNQWLSVLTACKHAGVSLAQTDAWSRRGGVRYQEGEVETRWQGLHLDVSWGAVVNLAKANGYTPPPRAKRYIVDSCFVHTTSNIDTERAANKSGTVEWIESTKKGKKKQMLILGSAAGSGKTRATTRTIDTFLYVAKTTGEADKVFDELFDAEEDVIRHRSRMFNRDHPDWETLPLGLGDNERPCIDPVLCNEHAAKLGSPNEVCYRCPMEEHCNARGYRSQTEKELNTSKVIYAWNEDFICDETLKWRLKRVCTADKVFILDEANPLNFTQLRTLDRDMLLEITERFRQTLGIDHEIYQTLKALLDLISTAEDNTSFVNGLSDWITGIDDIDALDNKISKFPVRIAFHKSPSTAMHNQPFEATLHYRDQETVVPVVNFETADDTPVFYTEDAIALNKTETRFMPYSFLLKVGLASLENPPHRYRFVKDIHTFLKENRVIDAAPSTFDAKEQCFTFHLKPTLNHRRVIVNTASDPDNLIAEAYRETKVQITRHEGTPPPWESESVFQIASGTYLPRHSQLTKDGKNLVLKKYAVDMIEGFIKPSIKAGLKTLVIAPKAFQEVESVKEWAITDNADYKPKQNAIITNHHRAEGRNDYQDCEAIFVFHYEPNHHEIQTASKHIYRNAEIPLDFTRETQIVKVNGVRFEKTVYKDIRVQSIYNRECRARLMQSAMRLRPNIHAGKIIVILTAEPIDIPVTPVPFTPRDKDKFNGDWTDFKKKLQASPQERIADGESKSKAYRDSSTHKKKKVERDAQVLALHQQGKNKSEIHRETDVPRKTVSDIIKRYEQGGENSHSTIVCTYSTLGKSATPTNTDDTGVESEPLHTQEPSVDQQASVPPPLKQGDQSSTPLLDSTNSSLTETVHPIYTDVPCVESEPLHISEPDAQTRDTSPPIPPTEYSSLDLETVNQELKRCQERNNYNGAAFLRSHIQKRERQLRTLKKGASMDYYNILTIPGSELFAKIKEINTIANDDTSPERDTAIDALNNLSSLLEQRCGSREDVMIAPGHLLTFGENPQRAT